MTEKERQEWQVQYEDLQKRVERIEQALVELLHPKWNPQDFIHGVNCPKIVHRGLGYGHGAGDDKPYVEDRIRYCGRCHAVL